jgi:SAF domain-containing protein
MNLARVTVIVVGILLIAAGVMVGILITAPELTKEQEQELEFPRSMVVAKRDLPAYTLLTGNDLEPRRFAQDAAGTAAAAEAINKLTNHYLAVSIKRGAEVKEENLASASATEVLKDAIAISIPVPSTNFLGAQLRSGDIVGLLAVPKAVSSATVKTPVATCEPLLVMNVASANKETTAAGSITFAVPSGQYDNCVAALANTDLLLKRKLAVQKP